MPPPNPPFPVVMILVFQLSGGGRNIENLYDEVSDDCTSIFTAQSSGSSVTLLWKGGLGSNEDPPSAMGVA